MVIGLIFSGFPSFDVKKQNKRKNNTLYPHNFKYSTTTKNLNYLTHRLKINKKIKRLEKKPREQQSKKKWALQNFIGLSNLSVSGMFGIPINQNVDR